MGDLFAPDNNNVFVVRLWLDWNGLEMIIFCGLCGKIGAHGG